MTDKITLRDIYLARQRIAPVVNRTHLVESPWLTEIAGTQVSLKLENHQVTGSFKIRGATNKMLGLTREARGRGIVTVSSGNHGRAVSYIARSLGVRAVVCLPETVPENKREAIRALGAETVVKGQNADEAMAYADQLRHERGLTMVHPFDDPMVIAGQGTIGLELLEGLPQLDTVVVPLSGGGLLAGIALAVKSANPSIRTIGVSMERGAAMVDSLKAGKIVDIVEEPTLADALAGGLNPDNTYTFKMIQQYVDDTVLVSEEEIAAAMAFTFKQHHLVVEGGGAVGIAAILHSKVERLGKQVVVVVSGGNVDTSLLMQITQNQYPHQSD
jgi:threonine dehydratase